MSEWMEYEAEKAAIRDAGLTPEEYEAAITEIIERLGI